MEKSNNNFIATAFVGIDVHDKSWKVCLLSDAGYKKEFSCRPETHVLMTTLRKLLPDFKFECAYEAGFSGFWLHDELNEINCVNCIIVHPADIPTTNKEKAQKEDRRDARKIAQQLKGGAIKGIYVPNKTEVGLREIQRLQFTITKDLTASKNRTKAFLKRYNIQPPKEKFPNSKTHWSAKFIKWLRSIEFNDSCLKFTLNNLTDCVVQLRQQKAQILKELRIIILNSKKDKEYNKLTTIKGIGAIGAATILTEIVDIKRFRSYESFHSFIGLVPSTANSANTEKIRGVTKRANRRLRNIFIEASWVAIKYDTDLHHYYHELKQRMKGNKAIIRVAKKLATKVRYNLLELHT